jgi:hypothetical protein
MSKMDNLKAAKEPYTELDEYLKIEIEPQKKLVEMILKSAGKFVISIKDIERGIPKSCGVITAGPKQTINANDYASRNTNIKFFDFGDKILLLGASLEYLHSGTKEILLYGLFKETYVTIPVVLEKFEREFAIVTLPEPEIILRQNQNKDTIDKWLETKLKISGRLLSSRKSILATRGSYISYLEESKNELSPKKKSLDSKYISPHSKVIGLSVYRSPKKQKIIFEFVHNGELFWWTFNQKKAKTKGIIFEENWFSIGTN